jgi:hypothetical protein
VTRVVSQRPFKDEERGEMSTNRVYAFTAAFVVVLAAVALSVPASAGAAAALDGAGVGARSVVIDFSTFGQGALDPMFYLREGIIFQSGREVSLVQGDDAVLGGQNLGPIEAQFTRPVDGILVSFAPRLQGTATYILRAFSAKGELLGTAAVTVTEDFGDPANEGFGYHTVSLANLPKPAKAFTFESIFVRSSFELVTSIGFGVNYVAYSHWFGGGALGARA